MILCNSDHVLICVVYREDRSTGSSISALGEAGSEGDNLFTYMSRWLLYVNEASLEFEATMASIKMESPGPVYGTMENGLDRISSD